MTRYASALRKGRMPSSRYRASTLPRMFEWKRQKYVTVPACANVNVNVPPWPSTI